MTKKILNIYKPPGVTPLEIIQNLRRQKPEYKELKIGYAGRLDPMAEGVLLLMVGEETKKRHIYNNLSKVYQCTALLGLTTDSYDVLGVLSSLSLKPIPEIYDELINRYITATLGKQTQEYPPFSSKTVNGIQLYKWAKAGKISEIAIPTKEVEYYSIIKDEISSIGINQLKALIKIASNVQGYFRQDQVAKTWTQLFKTTAPKQFVTVSFTIRCSSGTYIRSFINNLGNFLGCGAIAIKINRTAVGNFRSKYSLKI